MKSLEQQLRDLFGEPTHQYGHLVWFDCEPDRVPDSKSPRFKRTEQQDGRITVGLEDIPASVLAKHAEIAAEIAKIPTVSSHELARRILELPDMEARILWGSWEHPIQMEIQEEGYLLFHG